MTTTIIRVKRSFSEEPQEAFVLNYKKRKLCESEKVKDEEVLTIFKFAGTLKDQESDITKLINTNVKKEIKENYKQHKIDFNEKLRKQHEEDSKNSRFKIVNYHRHGLDEKETTGLTILDIETKEEKEKNDKYVYDYYYVTENNEIIYSNLLEDYCSVYPVNEDLVYGSMKDNGLDEQDSEDDSDDSNAENNWRNDYPDESDVDSIDENDMIAAMDRVDLSDNLSSDDDDVEDKIYGDTDDNQACGYYVEEVDDEDIMRNGKKYAEFKAKHKNLVTTGLDKEFYYGDIDEDEYYY